MGTFRAGHYVGVGVFILSLCVIFAGFANQMLKISFDDTDATIQLTESAGMVWPQYTLLLTSLLLCFWVPDTLYQTIIRAVTSIGGGF